MAGIYLGRAAGESSRVGVEVTAQTGEDAKIFVRGGIFGSVIGYDSLYAKDNFTAIQSARVIVRGEYRVDDSRGAGGGFFAGADDHLVPTQHLFIAAMIVAFDAAGRP